MTESRKIQLISEVDATGAKKGLSEINEAAKRTADEVSKAGKDGAKGLDGINEAGKKLGDGLKRISREGSDGLRKIPEEANKGAAGIDRATRTIISQIQRTTATLEAGERGTRSYYEAIAKQRGISNEALRPYLEQLEAVRGKQVQATTAAVAGAAGLKTVGVSAAQTAAALRQVPAQLTDIVVGLQAGQAPMTVLLQQGGQLKDMFGGIAPAARALGGAVLGMVNPFTLAAGAAVALAVAYNQGANEAQRYREAIIRSNGAIGVTADQLGVMARRISEVNGTQGQAAAALAEFAGASRVAREDLERFASAAANLQRVAGAPIAETRKQFEELGKAPVEALLKLNEGTNFLTGALYEQVRALEQQGRTVEAARIAQAAWASETERVVAGLEANLGLLERGWRGITSAAKSAWDAMLAVGRESSANDRIQAQVDLVKQLERELASVEARGLPGAQALRGQIETIKQQIASARQVVQLEAEAAAAKAKTVEQEQAKLRWAAEGVKFLSDQKKLEQEIAQIRAQGAAAGASLAEIEERVAKVRERAAGAIKQGGAAKIYEKDAAALDKLISKLEQEELLQKARRQNAEFDAAFEAVERERKAIEDRIRAGREMLAGIELETQLLGMSAVERETTIALLQLERAGVVEGTEAYERYAEAVRGAIVDRDAVRRSIDQTKQIEAEWQRTSDQIGQSLADALMNGGKSAADYLKGLFRNLVLQPLLRPVVAALGGFGGMAGTASAATGGGGSSLGMVGSIAGISGAFGTGLASSFGSMAAAGVGGWASAAGSLLGSGSMAGFAAGAGMIAAPLIAAAVVASLFKGGETRAGGRYGLVDGRASYLEGPSGGQVGPMAEAVQSVIDSINATLTAVGSQVAVTAFAAGVETSKNSRGGAFAGGALSTGATFGDTTDAVGWRYSENLDASDAGARFARELQMATLEALRAADLGGSIGQILSETDIGALSDDAMAGLITQIQSTVVGVNAFRDSIAGLPMDNLAGLSFAAADQLAALSGGVENLSQRLAGYYENYYTEAERSAALTAQLTGIFGEMGMSLPSSRDAFREIVDAQDLTTEAGRQTYAALLGVADAFAQVTPAAEIAAEVFEETLSQALERMRSRVRSVDDIAANIIDLERQLARERVAGDVGAMRELDMSGLTEIERGLMQQIYALQDAREAEAQAAQQAADSIREAAAAQEAAARQRETLERQIMQLSGDTAAIRAAELAAIDPANRALQERIYALQDAAAAEQSSAAAAQRIASERAQLESRVLQLVGDTAAIRAAELAALDPSNRALLERIYALEDEASAAQVAADAARALADEQRRVASERAQLERQLLEINGDTAAIRALDIAALDESNRALQQQIWARQDQIAAEAEATRIAEQARQAAEQAAAESARRIEAIANERQGLERQLLGLIGDTAGLRAMERAALDESNRALYDRIAAIQDQQAAEQAAAQARADRESRASAIAAERESLEMRILQLQGNTAAIRERERAALDVSNRGLYDRIVALEAMAEAEARATAILDERRGLERQMLQAQGDTVAIRALELSALDESNRALQEQVWAIQDAAAITAERAGLESRLLQLQGNTAELRARELAQLDESNRALQEQIWALEDAAKAWGGVTDAIESEVRRIRGLSDRDQSLSAAQARFAIASAQARAGDADAAGLLPGLSQSLLAAAERQATTVLELERLRAATANSLEQTAQIIETKPPESMSIDFAPVVTTLETLRSDSRAQSAATISLINRLVKIVEGWEAQGIPEERAV